MPLPVARHAVAFAFGFLVATPASVTLSAQVTTLPSETPAKLTPTFDGFDHVRRTS